MYLKLKTSTERSVTNLKTTLRWRSCLRLLVKSTRNAAEIKIIIFCFCFSLSVNNRKQKNTRTHLMENNSVFLETRQTWQLSNEKQNFSSQPFVFDELHWSFRSWNHERFTQPTGMEIQSEVTAAWLTDSQHHTYILQLTMKAEDGALCGGWAWLSEQYYVFLVVCWSSQ